MKRTSLKTSLRASRASRRLVPVVHCPGLVRGQRLAVGAVVVHLNLFRHGLARRRALHLAPPPALLRKHEVASICERRLRQLARSRASTPAPPARAP